MGLGLFTAATGRGIGGEAPTRGYCSIGNSPALEIWQDERQRWRWRWQDAEIQAARGFWALGEALVDAVVARYPAAFDTQLDADRT